MTHRAHSLPSPLSKDKGADEEVMRIIEYFPVLYTELLTYGTHVLVVLAKTLHEEERVCLWLRFKWERAWKHSVLMRASPLLMLLP